ncbi:thioesterase [Arcobacter acticola]|uniref:Thioesterase n=1 Tax=Arcobacter acticola TaxID=1849015 RepID=A0A6M8ES41_9BACT|nr:hotdog fold thioesterase [Arcobacter acticola]QKE27335.1 thioesterase [Arcobacter acticola]
MSIWKKTFTLESLNEKCKNTAVETLGIKITKIEDNSLEGEMPVDSRTHQIHGILHGGASVLFAETLGSIAGVVAAKPGYTVVGLDINANHLRGVSEGFVVGIATAIHIGRTTQVWDIKIKHKETDKLVCISRLTVSVIEEKEE